MNEYASDRNPANNFVLKGIKNEDAIILDIRNEFEYDIGHFDGAVNLRTFTYAETWSALDKLLDYKSEDSKSKPVYMYCTGGIRCEKASAYLKGKGWNNVYQVKNLL